MRFFMSFDLSINIPDDLDIDRQQLAAELEEIFKSFGDVFNYTIPSKMPAKEIVNMFESVIFPIYPGVKQEFQTYCKQNRYQEEPLDPSAAQEFWRLMTIAELGSVNWTLVVSDANVKMLYSQLVAFTKKHQLVIFNPQAEEPENLYEAKDYPSYWEEE